MAGCYAPANAGIKPPISTRSLFPSSDEGGGGGGKVGAKATASPGSIDRSRFLPPRPCTRGRAAPRTDRLAVQGGYRMILVL